MANSYYKVYYFANYMKKFSLTYCIQSFIIVYNKQLSDNYKPLEEEKR